MAGFRVEGRSLTVQPDSTLTARALECAIPHNSTLPDTVGQFSVNHMFSPLPDQELFDLAMVGMAKQGWRKSETRSGDCRYRGPGGCKCAVGQLLTDDEAARFEGFNVSTLKDEGKLPTRLESQFALVLSMQEEHDSARFGAKGEDMANRFRRMATEFGLEFREDVYNAG